MSSITISIAIPIAQSRRTGNRVTALRWAGLLRSMGHRVRFAKPGLVPDADVLIALNAVKTAAISRGFLKLHPTRPLVVALTGTDVFSSEGSSDDAADVMIRSAAIVVLQSDMADRIPREHRCKLHLIVQSFVPPPDLPEPNLDRFDVAVIGHLRAVKDPFLAAKASRLLPLDSKITIVHLGGELEPGYAEMARAEERIGPRYRWLGELRRRDAIRTLARCRLLVMTSKSEGGPSAISEAIGCGVPVLSTRTSGAIGLLGKDYPGYFGFGDERELAGLLDRCERDPAFLGELKRACTRLSPLFDVEREREAWKRLLSDVIPS